jgi:hypothetical protein
MPAGRRRACGPAAARTGQRHFRSGRRLARREQTDVTYLAPAAQQCLSERQGKVLLRGQAGALVIVAYPVELEGQVQGAVVLDVAERSDADRCKAVLRQLHWGIGWIETLFLRRQNLVTTRRPCSARAAPSTCWPWPPSRNACRRWRWRWSTTSPAASPATASSLGVDRGGRARLLAMSHSAFFEKKSQFVTALENAMDEALDQRRSVVFPPSRRGSGGIAIAHRDFAATRAVCSVVLAAAASASAS